MSVVAPFDPWRGRLCTCPPKYSLSPYTGCAHACRYCYITSYIPDGFRSRPKERFLERLQKDLGKLSPQILISIANSSDPYTPPEEQSQLTRRALEILLERGFRVQLITKSDLVARDADIIASGNCSVSFTITTLDEEVSSRLEPRAPPPSRRLEALRRLTQQGVPCSARLDPIIPFLNDRDLEDVVRVFADAGASHVTASTYKARPDSFHRITTRFPDLEEKLTDLYWARGEAIGRVRYLPSEVRKNIIGTVKTIAGDYGLTFGVCREGIVESSARARCDGTHLIPLRRNPGS
jgi:DNA repair photolyase